MTSRNSQWLIPLFLTIGAAGGLWYYWMQVTQPESAVDHVEPLDTPHEPQSIEPAYPLQQPTSEVATRQNLMPLPPLDQSDDYFKLDLTGLFGSGLDTLLVDTAVIEKIVATVDNLPRNRVAERIRPIRRVVGPFLADGQDDSGQYTINSASYDRYDYLVNLLSSADIEALVEIYRRYYPLFQEAYAGLGYPDGYFNDRVIAVIDHLLETPEIRQPVELVRPHVLYEYSDPELEGLSGGQKLLLRMGSDHALRTKQFLEELRILLAESTP